MFLIVTSQNEKRDCCYNLLLLWMPCLFQGTHTRFSSLLCLCSILLMVRWHLVVFGFVFPEALLTFNFVFFLFFPSFFSDKVLCTQSAPKLTMLLRLVLCPHPYCQHCSALGLQWCQTNRAVLLDLLHVTRKQSISQVTPGRELSVLFWTSLVWNLMSSVQIQIVRTLEGSRQV